MKVNPDIFKSGPGLSAALLTPPEAMQAGETTSAIPPESALDLDSDIVDLDKAMSVESLTAAVSDRLPFSDDIEVHDVFREPHADDVLLTFLEKLPEGVSISTTTTDYVNIVVSRIFSKMYREDHCIPKKDDDFTESIIPPVPRSVLSFLHNLAVHNANDYKDEFDTETFWRMIRQNFAVPAYAAPATKPTASDLVMQGRVVVATEELLSKLRRTHDRESYKKYVEDLIEGQSPATLAGPPDVTAASKDQDLNITRLHLRSRVVEATKESQAALQRSGITSKKRVMETETVVESKKPKKM